MNKESVIAPKSYVLKKLGEEVMVTSDSMEDIIIVNELGSDILEYISANGSVKVSSIIEKICQEYEADTIEKDILEFLSEMVENEVISVE